MPINKIRQTTDTMPNAPTDAWAYFEVVSDVLQFNSDGSNTRSMVSTAQTQTLTNKTLTSPVVAGDLGVNDDVSLELGTDDDIALRLRSTTLAANTALTDVIVGTPVVPAIAANSLIVSNVTADGDILVATQTGGNSQAAMFVDASTNTTSLYAAGVEKVTIDSTGLRNRRSAEVVTAANIITAAESGRTFFLNSATEFASTLPAPALGVWFDFIVTAAPSGASYTVVTEGGCQIMAGHVLTSGFADSGSDVETAATGTTITFVDGVSVVGDRAHIISDGTSWFASCVCAAEAGITITG